MPTANDLGIDSVERVLTDIFKLEGEVVGDEYMIHCPNPNHNDRRPSCSVNLKNGLWHCFACGSGGDLIALGKIVLGINSVGVQQLLRPNTREAMLNVIQNKITMLTQQFHIKPKRESLILPGPYASGPLNYMLERGFAMKTLRRWGVRYVRREVLDRGDKTFEIAHSIAIPIRDRNGNLLAWIYRRTNQSANWQPKYLYTPHAPINEFWFGLQHHAERKDITIVEGSLDAMWCDQAGIPALALLGSAASRNKINFLKQYQTVTLLGDRDAAGVRWVVKLGAALAYDANVKVARYPRLVDAKDPQDLSPELLIAAVQKAVPWIIWQTDSFSSSR